MSNDNRPDSELNDEELADRYFKQNNEAAIRERYNVKSDPEVVELSEKLEALAGPNKRIGTEDGRNFESISMSEGAALKVKNVRFGMMMHPIPDNEIPDELRATIPEGKTIEKALHLLRFSMEDGSEKQVALEPEQLMTIVNFATFVAMNPDAIMERMKATAEEIIRDNG